MTGTLTTRGASPALQVKPHGSFSYTLAVNSGSFVGTAAIQASLDGQTWQTIASYTGTEAVPLTTAALDAATIADVGDRGGWVRAAIFDLDAVNNSGVIGYSLTNEVATIGTVPRADGGPILVRSHEQGVGLAAGAYANFGAVNGSGGYGLRDNAGVMEAKDSGGGWTPISSAAAAALAAAGLSTSVSYVKTDTGTKTVLAANATKDRGVLVILEVTETYAAGTGTAPTVKVGETSTVEKGVAAATVATKALGTVLVAGFVNTSTKAILVTLTAAAGNGTGACRITFIALPNS